MNRKGLRLCSAVTLVLFAGCTPKPSHEVRRVARQKVTQARRDGSAPLGVVTNPDAPDHVFVYDPDELIVAAKRDGKNPAAVYHFSEYDFDRACDVVEHGWYYCLVS